MSITYLPDAAQQIVARQGWNEESVLVHLNSFITEKDLEEALTRHLAEAAAEENDETAPDADDDLRSVEDIVEEQGWNKDSQIMHIAALIRDKGLEDELVEHFDEAASFESPDEQDDPEDD